MSTKTIDMDPIEIVDLLKEKLRKAKEAGKLDRREIHRLMPNSLKKGQQYDTPAYEVGSLRKANEQAKMGPIRQGAHRQVPPSVIENYMRQFADAKAKGRFSHLSEAMIKKLEDEVRVSASDATKTAELEEFFRSIYNENVESM